MTRYSLLVSFSKSVMMAVILGQTMACGVVSDQAPDLLERFEMSVTLDNAGLAENPDYWHGDTMSLVGSVSVSGSDRDYVLELTSETEGAQFQMDIHSPGMLDLSRIGGELQVFISDNFYNYWQSGDSLAAFDSEGLVYMALGGGSRNLAEDFMGKDFVEYGDSIAKTQDDDYRWSYHSLIFQTDEGPVELLAGDSDYLVVDGSIYQVVVIGAYTLEKRLFSWRDQCAGLANLLSFELLRVDEAPEATVVERPNGLQKATLGCDESNESN